MHASIYPSIHTCMYRLSDMHTHFYINYRPTVHVYIYDHLSLNTYKYMYVYIGLLSDMHTHFHINYRPTVHVYIYVHVHIRNIDKYTIKHPYYINTCTQYILTHENKYRQAHLFMHA